MYNAYKRLMNKLFASLSSERKKIGFMESTEIQGKSENRALEWDKLADSSEF
jgi:hypothetical protein